MPDEPTTTDVLEVTTDNPTEVTVDLGDAGKKALDAERAARKAAERAAKKATDDLEALRTASLSDTERAIAEAKAEGRKAALAEVNGRLLRSEIKAAATGRLADPSDAAALLGDLDEFLDGHGEPDSKAIAKAIDALVNDKPYLAAAGSRPGGLPGGGAKPSNGFSINDEIRRQAGR